jgi:AbiV family abortive infection protein
MSDGDVEEGVKRSLANASSLLRDGRLLLTDGDSGHALFLIISAIEETSKGLLYAGGRSEVWQPEEVGHDVRHHFPKYQLFLTHVISRAIEDVFQRRSEKILHPNHPAKPLNVDDFVQMAQDFYAARNELWDTRNRALYVEKKGETWTSPSEIKKSEVETLLKYAERYLSDTEFQARNILQAPKNLSIQYHQWLENVFVPFAGKFILSQLDELYEEKLISKDLYEKLKKKD